MLDFVENVLPNLDTKRLPLMMLQKKIGCHLILVHQLTNHPKNGEMPYLFRIYKEIPSTWIKLIINGGYHEMQVKGNSIKYQINRSGIEII